MDDLRKKKECWKKKKKKRKKQRWKKKKKRHQMKKGGWRWMQKAMKMECVENGIVTMVVCVLVGEDVTQLCSV